MNIKNILKLLIVSSFIGIQFVSAQNIAGLVYPGTSKTNPNISLTVNEVYKSANGSFDIDCDGVNDMRANIYKGPTAFDGASSARLFVTNPLFQICSDIMV